MQKKKTVSKDKFIGYKANSEEQKQTDELKNYLGIKTDSALLRFLTKQEHKKICPQNS